MQQTRRQFLAGSIGTIAIGGSSNAQGPKGKSLPEAVGSKTLKDQHGEKLNMAEMFKDGPCLVVFGFGGCARCQEITNTVAAIQQKIPSLPIVVISSYPENDRGKMKDYIASYYAKGVKQFNEEKLPADEDERVAMGKQAFELAKSKAQSARVFHIVCPENTAAGKKIAMAMGFVVHPKDPKQHPTDVTLYNKGMWVNRYKALNNAKEAPPEFAKEVADKVLSDVSALQTGKGIGN